MSKKYYAVKVGAKPGIYTTWEETSKQVLGYSKSQYKSFSTKKEAEEYIASKKKATTKIPNNMPWKSNSTIKGESPKSVNLNLIEIYVEGYFDYQKNSYSFGCVLVSQNEIVYTHNQKGNKKQFLSSKQITGTLLGIIYALRWAIDNGYAYAVIHYDDLVVENLASGKWRAHRTVPKLYVKEYNKLTDYIHIKFIKESHMLNNKYGRYARKLAKDVFM